MMMLALRAFYGFGEQFLYARIYIAVAVGDNAGINKTDKRQASTCRVMLASCLVSYAHERADLYRGIILRTAR